MNQPATVTPTRRRWWWIPFVAAMVLVVAAVVGAVRPGSLVVFDWLNRPFLFGSLALGLLALACWSAPFARHWRLLLVAALVVAAGGWAAIGTVIVPAMRSELTELSRHRSPDGARELRLYSGRNIIDPTWELRLHTGDGVTARVWDLGCVNGDIETLTRVEWIGPNRLRVHLSSLGPVDITLDSSSGRPDQQLSVSC